VPGGRASVHAGLFTIILALTQPACGQPTADTWLKTVRTQVGHHQLDAALMVVDQRLAESPDDFEAHGWRGRVLSWKGRWPEGEAEYRRVLEKFPDDSEMLACLADVLLWQKRLPQSLDVLDRARQLNPDNPEILSRRASLLRQLGRNDDARLEYLETLRFDPKNREAKSGLARLRAKTRHELRIGNDTDLFSYTGSAQTQNIALNSRWSRRWSTSLGSTIYQRFGETAGKFLASAAYHPCDHDSIGIGGAVANQQNVAPTREAFFEYGHGFQFDNRIVPGLETSYEQHWYWYRGAQVLTLSLAHVVYLPRDWTLALTVTGGRTVFPGHFPDWEPSGWTRLGFPLHAGLSGNIFYAVGSENYAKVDQIGRLAAHTYGGGLRYQFGGGQDITGFAAWQQRTLHQTETNFGLSYGIRF
jgi:Flp pilus assembly protein TadD